MTVSLDISFVGASCTAQRSNHTTQELTGYVEYFRRFLARELGISAVYQDAYPGNRFAGPGPVKISDVVSRRGGGICVLELLIEDHSRGRASSSEDYLSACKSLMDANILPIFLNLPKGGVLPLEQWPQARMIAEISAECNIPSINIVPVDSAKAIEKSMFNGPNHTNFNGAKYYAETISQFLISVLGDRDLRLQNISIPERVQSKIVSRIPAETPRDSFQKFKLQLKRGQNQNDTFGTLIHLHKIGPFSPVVSFRASNAGGLYYETSMSLWDEFCHYDRYSYLDFKFPLKGSDISVEYEVSDILPKYETCRREHDFSEFFDKSKRVMHAQGDAFISAYEPLPGYSSLL
ncbi:hypothetical protein GFB56_32865 [Ensifer sp. T173]|uniref:Uncharacterized protein n=1 Tax=Ensifer canadensis TaxID=555315 RepID=A0AAW4FVY6_9HYPH|nr:hypothetical protein [Ensifer canadensis]MBM3095516.1 hypothetical protein [Ensifer canadensis]UBI79112.1 hypothetical protein J3R84_23730 [Ensifer canadensis]